MLIRAFIILFITKISVLGQESADGLIISCDHSALKAYISSNFRFKQNLAPTARFSVTYIDVPEKAKKEIQEAIAVWESILISNVVIETHIFWETLPNSTLATAGSSKVYKNFSNAPIRDVWYPTALAESINGKNLNGKEADIVLKINKNTVWKILNPNHADAFDLHSVILHEIAHGIGFISSFEKDDKNNLMWGIQNLPFVFDHHLTDYKGNMLTNNRFYTNGSNELTEALTQLEVFFNIEKDVYPYPMPKVHTPTTFSQGASLSHFSTYQNSFIDPRDQLMYPSLLKSSHFDAPGLATLGVLYSLGWEINGYPVRKNVVEEIVLYPNPAHDFISIKSNFKEIISYSIYNENGKRLLSDRISNHNLTISIKHLMPGKYYLRTEEKTIPFYKI